MIINLKNLFPSPNGEFFICTLIEGRHPLPTTEYVLFPSPNGEFFICTTRFYTPREFIEWLFPSPNGEFFICTK